MAFQLEDTWFGEGLLWKRLIIRNFFGGVQGILMDSESFMNDREIDLSHVNSLEEAIQIIQQEDYDYYYELTLYGEEGSEEEKPNDQSN
jgi:hypothetical protein